MFDTKKVAREIREARIAKNMTQMNLADKMGVSYQAVSNWERGGSMPDIGKLEDLCAILDLGLDRLLGVNSQAENVRRVIDYTNGKSEEHPSMEAIGEAAPLMNPETLNQMAEEASVGGMDLSQLIGLAPFLGREALGRLASRVDRLGLSDLNALAPFLDSETVGKLSEKIPDGDLDAGRINGLGPFMDSRALGRLASRLDRLGLSDLNALAPFLDCETVGKLSEKIPDGDLDAGRINGLGPFMDSRALGRLVSRLDRLGLSDLNMLAPFLDCETVGKLSEKIPDGDLDAGRINGLGPFMDSRALGRLVSRLDRLGLSDLNMLAPFLDCETVGALAEKLPEEELDWGGLEGLAPFMGRETLERLVLNRKTAARTKNPAT